MGITRLHEICLLKIIFTCKQSLIKHAREARKHDKTSQGALEVEKEGYVIQLFRAALIGQ